MRIGVVAELRHADTADVLLWDSYTDAVPCVKKLVQEYFPIIRQEFLQFICDIGRHTVDGATISEQFRLLTYFSAWEYSSLFERHPAYYGDALFTIFKLRALELYCQKVRPQEVCLCGCDDVARHISSICKAQQITFVHSPSSVNSKEGPDGPSCSAMAFVRKSASMVRQLRCWWKQVRSQFPAQPVVRRCKGMILGTWFPNIDQEAAQAGRFRSKYWEDAHDLIDSSATPQHWFFIYADREQSIPDHIASRDRFAANAPNADMTFLEECLTPCDALRAFGLWLRSAWRSSIMGNRVAEAFNWPHSALNVFSLLQDIWQRNPHLDGICCGCCCICRPLSDFASWLARRIVYLPPLSCNGGSVCCFGSSGNWVAQKILRCSIPLFVQQTSAFFAPLTCGRIRNLQTPCPMSSFAMGGRALRQCVLPVFRITASVLSRQRGFSIWREQHGMPLPPHPENCWSLLHTLKVRRGVCWKCLPPQ